MTHVGLDASADLPECIPLAVLPDSTGILIEDRHVRSYAHRRVRLYADILVRLLPRWRDDPISLAHLGADHTGGGSGPCHGHGRCQRHRRHAGDDRR